MSVAHDPHYGPWTMEEVLALGEDRGQRRELMGEALMMSPAPGTKHQRALSRLWSLLDRAVQAEGMTAEASKRSISSCPTGSSSRTSWWSRRPTLVEKPFPLEVDPAALVSPRGKTDA